jgi:UDP-glucose 4-epimerase
VERVARAAGTRSRQFALPTQFLSGVLTISGRQEMRYSLIGSLEIDVSKVTATGWQPTVTLDEGLRLALASTAQDGGPRENR